MSCVGVLTKTAAGRRQYECKVRTATLGGAVKRANENLTARDLPPLPAKLTPHSLRRTFATLLDAALGLRAYAQDLRLSDHERTRAAELVEGGFGHSMDTKASLQPLGSRAGEAA